MKKLSILGLTAAAAVLVLAGMAEARGRCGGRFFGGGGGCGHQSFYSVGCGGYSGPVYYQPKKVYMPSSTYSPSPSTLPQPPKKIQMPSADGGSASNIKTLYIYGQVHGQLPDGSYANIQNGDYARFTGKSVSSDGYGGYQSK